MTVTYADDESTSGSGSEERKTAPTAAWTFAISEETRGMSLLTAASANASQEGLDASTLRTEDSPRAIKREIEENVRSDSVISIDDPSLITPSVRSDDSSMENLEDEKGEEKIGSLGSSVIEGEIEQVSMIKTEGNKLQRKLSNETELSTGNEDDTKETSLQQEESIESDNGSSFEDLRRSIEKELIVNEEAKRFSPKKVVVTCGTFAISSNNTTCRIIDDDEKSGEVAEVEDYMKDESYDPETGLDFHEAVRAGDAHRVATLLGDNRVQNLDEPDWNVSGDPPLLVAATNHSLPVLNILLANGCDPGVRSPRGETALHRVILNGGPGNVLNFVEELLKYGCPAGVKEAGGGLTALHVLTRQLAHAQSSKSLHHDFEAALKTLDLLAKAGPINAKDHQGRSALHILASSTIFGMENNNHKTEIESLMETLLAAGANPALKNDRGETPLHECLECGALNTASLLIPHTPLGIMSRYGETPLHIASRKNYVDMVAKLLEHGEDPSIQDAGGNTPLHLASARGFHRTVSLLITSPLAQLEKTNLDGLTALQVAAESGFVNAVRLLLKAGADPSQTVHYCTTTLHRHPDISILIDHELTRRRQLAA